MVTEAKKSLKKLGALADNVENTIGVKYEWILIESEVWVFYSYTEEIIFDDDTHILLNY